MVYALVLCGLGLPGARRLWGQVRSYPVGVASDTTHTWVLPEGLARQWVEQGSALAGAELREIQSSRQQSVARRGLASLALAAGEMRLQQNGAAEQDLRRAAAWAPIRALVAAQLERLRWQQKDWSGVVAIARQYGPALNGSPFRFTVYRDAFNAAAQLQQWNTVLALGSAVSMSPHRLAIEAQALAALERPEEALRRLERLEDGYPASPEAAAAQAQWRELLQRYPTLAPNWNQLAERAEAWRRSGQARRAAETWQQAIAAAPAAQRETLRMQLARAWVAAGEDGKAGNLVRQLLRGPLRNEALEVDLERARARSDLGTVEHDLAQLRQQAPTSGWYRKALWEAGNEAVLDNDLLLAQAHYDMVAERFPHSGSVATAAWRGTWQSYRLNQRDAGARLDVFLRHFPHAPEDADALYWRGRWAERHGAPAIARQYYTADAIRFPGSYFGLEAAQRLTHLGTQATAQGTVLRQLLRTLPDAAPPPHPALLWRDRKAGQLAQALASAWMLDPAATILESALRQGGRPPLPLARQLVAIDRLRQAWGGGVSAMERALPGYLGYDRKELPQADWDALFPYPYRADIQRAARHWQVDPFLILGLIRQESDFNPRSFSHAGARGLMQLLYGTARMHARGLGWTRLSADDLFRPEINIPLGVAELKSLLVQFHGQPAYALAAYNAGGSRVTAWLQQGPYRSINEFIESIPFHETRGYVQAVLRNRVHYQRLY